MLHHRASVHSFELFTEFPGRPRPIPQQVQNLPPPIVGQRFEDGTLLISS
jgi:hypothetical protein